MVVNQEVVNQVYLFLFFMFVSISMILLVGFHILMSYEICLDGNHVHFADFLHQTT